MDRIDERATQEHPCVLLASQVLEIEKGADHIPILVNVMDRDAQVGEPVGLVGRPAVIGKREH